MCHPGSVSHTDPTRHAAEVVTAVVAHAQRHGIRCDAPTVLRDRANLLIWLAPTPVVARVPRLVAALGRDVRRHLDLEVALTQHLRHAGVPVVAPSPLISAGPHHVADTWCTYWRRYDLVDLTPTPAFVTSSLRTLHRAIADFPGDHTGLGPLADLRHACDQWEWTAAEAAALTRVIDYYAGKLEHLDGNQPLHGDAHRNNLLSTTDGFVWNDFEDSWRGPVEWDHATFANPSVDASSVPAGARGDVYQACRGLRAVQSALWAQVARPGDHARAVRPTLFTVPRDQNRHR